MARVSAGQCHAGWRAQVAVRPECVTGEWLNLESGALRRCASRAASRPVGGYRVKLACTWRRNSSGREIRWNDSRVPPVPVTVIVP